MVHWNGATALHKRCFLFWYKCLFGKRQPYKIVEQKEHILPYEKVWNTNTCAQMHKLNHKNRLHQLVPSLFLSPALLLSTRAYSHLPLIMFSYNWIQVRNLRAFRLPVCCCWCFVHSLHISTHHHIKSTTSKISAPLINPYNTYNIEWCVWHTIYYCGTYSSVMLCLPVRQTLFIGLMLKTPGVLSHTHCFKTIATKVWKLVESFKVTWLRQNEERKIHIRFSTHCFNLINYEYELLLDMVSMLSFISFIRYCKHIRWIMLLGAMFSKT